MIAKVQNDVNNFYFKELFYNRARDAMFDIINNLSKVGYNDIYIPGYIGWSPKEGSGIFDPINKIIDIKRQYYLMDENLYINYEYLQKNLNNNSILLVVNYFGFRDKNIMKVVELAHRRNCIVIEDNAHGFYTYHLSNKINSDFSFFSLHKMFPFQNGGSLIVNNSKYKNMNFMGKQTPLNNPYAYDIYSIAMVRKENFYKLFYLLEKHKHYIKPLREIKDIDFNVPQTFPIVLLQGNRDKIYEMMNEKGYGVVSLYHTMIEELQNSKYSQSIWLSKHILNLPLHQDVNSSEYEDMVNYLLYCIKETKIE